MRLIKQIPKSVQLAVFVSIVVGLIIYYWLVILASPIVGVWTADINKPMNDAYNRIGIKASGASAKVVFFRNGTFECEESAVLTAFEGYAKGNSSEYVSYSKGTFSFRGTRGVINWTKYQVFINGRPSPDGELPKSITLELQNDVLIVDQDFKSLGHIKFYFKQL